ncbi:MAG: NAD-dependent epimerase/dehydratase family protein [Bdellovibrionaceae bacterium]|nr:NAD-dependent epimerase/dehydratase family protein [Pseudobdellovibrionaceae bacterium]
MQKALITGATGFIGKHLAKTLCSQGVSVTALVRNPKSCDDLLKMGAQLASGDVTDSLSLLNAIEGKDIVYHLAGQIAYKASERAGMEKVNVSGTQKVMDACITHNTPNVIHMSSVVAIGASFDKTILDENSSYNIAHLNLGYFQTKHDAELIAKTAHTHNGLNVFILNPSTVYGPGDATKGSRSVQRKVAAGKFPFYTPGGVNVVHVDDVLYCLQNVHKRGKPGERYIVGGENLTIQEVFTIIARVAGVDAPKLCLPKAALKMLGWLGDTVLEPLGIKGPLSSETAHTSSMFHWFSNEKAKKELGLKPTSSEKAITESVRWMMENGYV